MSMGIKKELSITELIELFDHHKDRLIHQMKNLSEEGVAEEVVVTGKRLEAIMEEIDQRTDSTFNIEHED